MDRNTLLYNYLNLRICLFVSFENIQYFNIINSIQDYIWPRLLSVNVLHVPWAKLEATSDQSATLSQHLVGLRTGWWELRGEM